MRKTGISLLILIIASLLFVCAPNHSMADAGDGDISIMNYSLKPIGYVSGDRFIQSIWNIELQNNNGTAHSFDIKIVFFDKDQNELKEIKKNVDIDASETKKYSDAVLLDPTMAKQIATTKAFIENIQ